jgi:hypothetical protein
MDTQKKLESEAPFVGLWVRTARALRGGGYTSREQVKADIESKSLRPYVSIHDYGRKAHVEVITWLAVNGDMPRSKALELFRETFGLAVMPYILIQMEQVTQRLKAAKTK